MDKRMGPIFCRTFDEEHSKRGTNLVNKVPNVYYIPPVNLFVVANAINRSNSINKYDDSAHSSGLKN